MITTIKQVPVRFVKKQGNQPVLHLGHRTEKRNYWIDLLPSYLKSCHQFICKCKYIVPNIPLLKLCLGSSKISLFGSSFLLLDSSQYQQTCMYTFENKIINTICVCIYGATKNDRKAKQNPFSEQRVTTLQCMCKCTTRIICGHRTPTAHT